MKSTVKKILPLSVANFFRRLRSTVAHSKYQGMSNAEIFTHIYTHGQWGRDLKTQNPFYSGTGSHDGSVVKTYTTAVVKFLTSLPMAPNVVDLGCGDFAVGSQIRHFCNQYIACDVVSSLIEHNKQKYSTMGVDFRCLDLTEATLPAGDVVFIRQVLQHLSNASIQRLLPKLIQNYKYIVLTEHISTHSAFRPNIDKPTGPDTRLGLNSGIVLTEHPFNLRCTTKEQLCEAVEDGGLIQTILITL